MIIDAHNHIGQVKSPLWGEVRQLPEDLLGIMDQCGIDRAVVWPMLKEHSLQGHREAYEFVHEVMNAEPRLIGFAYVNPRVGPELVGEVRRAIQDLGLKGLKFHPFSGGYYADDNIMTPYIELAIEFNVPVTIHTDFACRFSTPYRVVNLARRFPQAKLIMAHMGLDPIQVHSVPNLIKDLPNVYLELSAIPDMPSLVRKAVNVVGPERVVFGSDTPDLHPKLALEKVHLAELSPKQEELVLGGSIARILDL